MICNCDLWFCVTWYHAETDRDMIVSSSDHPIIEWLCEDPHCCKQFCLVALGSSQFQHEVVFKANDSRRILVRTENLATTCRVAALAGESKEPVPEIDRRRGQESVIGYEINRLPV